jgi:hypothetical protein
MAEGTQGTQRTRRTVLCVLCVLCALCVCSAIRLTLGSEDVDRALRIGRSSEAERARFHAPYIVALHDATLQQIEVLTEFRRAVLESENRMRLGDHMFSVRPATEMLRPWRGKLTLALRLRFHPHNVFVAVPPYEIAIGAPAIVATDVRRRPEYVLGADPKRGSMALYGGVVEEDFDAAAVGQTTRAVRVVLDGKELATTTINFARIE